MFFLFFFFVTEVVVFFQNATVLANLLSACAFIDIEFPIRTRIFSHLLFNKIFVITHDGKDFLFFFFLFIFLFFFYFYF